MLQIIPCTISLFLKLLRNFNYISDDRHDGSEYSYESEYSDGSECIPSSEGSEYPTKGGKTTPPKTFLQSLTLYRRHNNLFPHEPTTTTPEFNEMTDSNDEDSGHTNNNIGEINIADSMTIGTEESRITGNADSSTKNKIRTSLELYFALASGS